MHQGARPRLDPVRVILQIIALALALVASAFALFAPTLATSSTTGTGDDGTSYASLFESFGPGVILSVVVPLILTVLPLLTRGRTGWFVSLVSMALLTVFVVVASATIGWFYVPALVAGIVALTIQRREYVAAAGVNPAR